MNVELTQEEVAEIVGELDLGNYYYLNMSEPERFGDMFRVKLSIYKKLTGNDWRGIGA